MKWFKADEGIRYREHPTRKHGVRLDRYFSIYYRLDGKQREEGLGWASKGWDLKKAKARLSELLENKRTGKGPVTLAESREQAKVEREIKAQADAETARAELSLANLWPGYLDVAMGTKPKSMRREKELWKLWVAPTVGSKPLKQVSPLDLERMKKRLAAVGRSARTIQYALALVRQMFNHARKAGLFAGDSPTKQVSKTKVVNQRVRFLSPEEAEQLLATLAEYSQDVHDQALLSLFSGCRWGEVAGLTWGNVDFNSNNLHLLDTKHGQRSIPMTAKVRDMLTRRQGEAKAHTPEILVFPARTGRPSPQVSQSFHHALVKLGFNDGVTDRRQKVCFHTLRHSYASWLVMAGTPLYTVARLLGHSTLSMTERYSHLAPDHVREAVANLEAFEKGRSGKMVRIGRD
ncbi:MAG: site-specific integrase [Desulfovibrionaceae bacterium]|nr:site-specific integrase [Desulfovibrionaceae bacterium]MBF0513900.1 site-specific integrase [Desulfovibrionaceae bacterium]